VRPTPTFCSLVAADAHVQLRLDTNPRFLHHDVLVIDGQTAITGSMNFSEAALKRNDENVVVIPDGELAKRYSAEFERLWPTATPPDPARCVPSDQQQDDVAMP
jgi:phosphatidylserine/phosphatidylglycerophosphate/cardiolipin synthase-like enzyme